MRGSAPFVEGVGETFDDVRRHGEVDLTSQLDEPRGELELARAPGQIKRVDRDAMAAEAGTGKERRKPEWFGGGRIDDLALTQSRETVDPQSPLRSAFSSWFGVTKGSTTGGMAPLLLGPR